MRDKEIVGTLDVDLLQFLERSRDIGFVEYHLPNKKKQTTSLVLSLKSASVVPALRGVTPEDGGFLLDFVLVFVFLGIC